MSDAVTAGGFVGPSDQSEQNDCDLYNSSGGLNSDEGCIINRFSSSYRYIRRNKCEDYFSSTWDSV